jgi:hypothetical protein
MPEQEYEPDDCEEGIEEEDDDEGDDQPTAIFVGMTFGKDGADEAFRVIAGVCDRLEIEAQRLPSKGGGSEALYEAVETSDFAIIDVSSKRPSLAAELECVDHEIAPEFIVLIARTGSPKLAEVENRIVHFYGDKGDLRALVERHLNSMIDAWHEGGADEGDDDESE